jgi:EAL domain-containing protein (putative c-di-GMP-specific phosphodiesterase class I)
MLNKPIEQCTLMVVDDDEIILEMVTDALEGLGAKHVLRAKNGQEALDLYDQHIKQVPLDTICIDLNMPIMDGIELMRHFADRDFSGNLVLMSGEDKSILLTAGQLAKEHHLAIADVLQKPVTIDVLEETLSNIAKIDGDSRVKVSDIISEIEITAEELRFAVEHDQLVMYYQPKVDAKSKKIVSAEALVRWPHPEKGIIPPDQFIGLAEENDLINMLTNQVIQKVIRRLAMWLNEGVNIKVGFNISAKNLESLDLPEFIISQANTNHVSAKNLIVEITESSIVKDMKKSFEILTRIRLKGIELSIDDFGTGFSSMEQLERIPFNELKIDRKFVTEAYKKPKSQAILQSSIALAKSLEMRTVAEGVETEEEFDYLANLGIDLIQGYYISKPVPANEFVELYKKLNA